MEDKKASSLLSRDCFIDCSIFVDFVFLFIFISLFSPCTWYKDFIVMICKRNLICDHLSVRNNDKKN